MHELVVTWFEWVRDWGYLGVLLLLEPVLNPLWTYLFQGERPGLLTNLGGALILGAALARSFWEARKA